MAEWNLPKGEKPDDLRWYATHEALSRHSIFDVLQWLADTMETHTLLPLDGLEETIARALREHLPKDTFDVAGDPVGTYCTGCDWTGDYFADGQAGPFDDHLAHHVARALAGDGAR